MTHPPPPKMKSLKPQLVGILVGALPSAFLWCIGAPENVVRGALVLGVMMGEVTGAVIGEALHPDEENG